MRQRGHDLAFIEAVGDFRNAAFERVDVHNLFFPIRLENLLVGVLDRQLRAVAERETGEAEDDRKFNARMTGEEFPCCLWRDAPICTAMS